MNRSTFAVFGGLLLLVLIFPIATGVAWVSSVILTFMIALQWWSGAWLWTRVRPAGSQWETLGAGLALGTSVSTFTGLLVTLVFGVAWGWTIPPALVLLAAFATSRAGSARGTSEDWSGAAWSAVSSGLVAGFAGLAWAVRSYPLQSGDWSRYHPDMGFFEAVGNSLASWGPLASIFTPDSLIRYHWLVYAWSGQLQVSSGAVPFTVLTRFLPVLALMGAVLVAVAWTRSITLSRWAPTLAVGLLTIGGFVGASYGTVLNFDSPSVAFTTMSLLVLSWMVGLLTTGDIPQGRPRIWLLGVVGLLAAMVSGGKVSSAAVAVGTVGVLWLASLRARNVDSRAALQALIVVTTGSIVAFLTVAAGSADPGGLRLGDLLDRSSSVQGMNPFPGSVGILIGTGVLALSAFFRGAGVLWLLSNKREREQPWGWMGLGLLVSSITPLLLISGGFNEVWFAVAAAGPLSVLSTVGLARGISTLPWRNTQWVIIVGSVGVAAVSAAVLAAWSTGPSGGNVWVSTFRWAGPLIGLAGALVVGLVLARLSARPGSVRQQAFVASLAVLVVLALSGRALTLFGSLGTQPGMRSDMFTPVVSFVETVDSAPPIQSGQDMLGIASWLRANSNSEDLVVTNVTVWPIVPALTNRQTLASGIRYQAPYGPASAVSALLEREEQSWGFITNPSTDSAQDLCRYPTRWLIVQGMDAPASSWEPWASSVLETDSVRLLRWNEDQC